MNTKTLVALLAIVGTLSVLYTQIDSKPELSAFEKWNNQFNVNYDSMFERAYRERIFLENLAKVELHNSEAFHTYKQGLNQFSALTEEEFVAMSLGLIVPQNVASVESNDDTFSADIDWTA